MLSSRLFSRSCLPRLSSRHFTINIASAASSQQQDSHPLVDWVEANGGNVQGVKVHRADGGYGYGLQSSGKVTAGSPLITLPSSCLLSYGKGSSDPKLLNLIDQVPSELWGGKLALALLAERVKATDSFFDPYIANLPLGFPGLPIFFNGPTINTLQYPPVKQQINLRCRWLLEFTSKNLAAAQKSPATDPFEGTTIDANALGWALAAVTSRAFRIGGLNKPAALLPLIDMANHSYTPNAKIVPVQNSALKGGSGMAMVALRDLEPGEPVLISYGALPNDFLLLDYGFIVPSNPHDTVQLGFSLELIEAAKAVGGINTPMTPEGQPIKIAPYQTELLKKLGLLSSVSKTEASLRQITDANPCPVEPKLLAAVRVLCAMSASQLERRSLPQLSEWGVVISEGHEQATLKTLMGLYVIALGQFTTTVDEDLNLLKNGKDDKTGEVLNEDMQLAIRFRIEKKELLMAGIQRLNQILGEPGGMQEYIKNAGGGEGGKSKNTSNKKGNSAVVGKGFA